MKCNASIILQPHQSTPSNSLYNFPVNDVNIENLLNQITYIYQQEFKSFQDKYSFWFYFTTY